jgi:hypothetical protein
MIELLIDWLDREIKQREAAILSGVFIDLGKFHVVRSEYQTLLAVREKAAQFASGGDDEEE